MSLSQKGILIKYVIEYQIWWLILIWVWSPQARVACETLTTTNKVVLAGETRGPEIKKEELISKVRDCIKDIGYDQSGFTWKEATKN